jgi:hypothetical protein
MAEIYDLNLPRDRCSSLHIVEVGSGHTSSYIVSTGGGGVLWLPRGETAGTVNLTTDHQLVEG